ncbi:MAG: hypothetical protein LQ338_005242 [Usnochroma carphineum]|nr:MAG: hypothetical protein LQ338_005242 [Usnochroma carphineum]
MPPSSQSSSKRIRTRDDDAQCPLDPNEELSQVAGLVERRRLQNKISQRNYRNRIRERLEALEALVDTTDKGQTANAPKDPGDASTARPGSTKRKLGGGSGQSPQDHSAVLTSETSDPWNMGNFLDTSTAQFDSLYDFTAPRSPVSPQALSDHVSTRECSPVNHTASVITAINVNLEQPATAGLEKLDGNREKPLLPDDVAAHVSTGSMSPQPPNGQSVHFNPINFGYPITPMSVPMQPVTPGSLPRKSIVSRNQSNFGCQITSPMLTISPAHIDRREANCDHVAHPSSYPLAIIPPMQCAGHLQPQQFIWVPVPVITLPPPSTQPLVTVGRPRSTIGPEAVGGGDTMGQRHEASRSGGGDGNARETTS